MCVDIQKANLAKNHIVFSPSVILANATSLHFPVVIPGPCMRNPGSSKITPPHGSYECRHTNSYALYPNYDLILRYVTC